MRKKEKEAVVRGTAKTCRGPLPAKSRKLVNSLMASGDMEKARQVNDDDRPGCGYDFNDTIMSNPLDGEVHKYECPDCGVKGEYRAPIFTEEENVT